MRPGRTPSWNVVAGLESGSWHEAVALSSDERLLLPLELRKRVSWAGPKRSLALLAARQDDGSVIVAPLADRAAELDAVRAALEAAPAAARASLAFTAMALYSRISLQPDGRLRLSPALARYLAGDLDAPVWVGAHGNQVWLWGDATWQASLSTGAAALREAVASFRTTR
jgi:DNA-binding transcriptional regulator/RsmH inhibitor MraZ